MDAKDLKRLRNTVLERTNATDWVDIDEKPGTVQALFDHSPIAQCVNEKDARFIVAADQYMEELISEVVRLRAVVGVLGLVAQFGDKQIQSLLDGGES
jgi:hypothetical protein